MESNKIICVCKSNIEELNLLIKQFNEIKEKIENFELKAEVVIPASVL